MNSPLAVFFSRARARYAFTEAGLAGFRDSERKFALSVVGAIAQEKKLARVQVIRGCSNVANALVKGSERQKRPSQWLQNTTELL